MNILADATLPGLASLFGPPFRISCYNSPEEAARLLPTQDILICRSTLKVTTQFLANSTIKCIATASSGIDHIDSAYLEKQGIALFDAKGSNARAVADYVVATLAYLSKNHLIKGSKAGIIGLGEVGTGVLNRLQHAGFEVICHDPIRETQDELYDYCAFSDLTTCDLLCVHPNFHTLPPYPSANLLSADFFNQLKPGVTIINAARGGIVDESALLKTRTPITYCTDVYLNEPAINEQIVNFATLCTPHIAGHSIEAKLNAVIMLSQKLHQFYQLIPPAPILTPTEIPFPDKKIPSDWKELVLSLYNPWLDTSILKNATNKTHAFLTQRQAHSNRHDFVTYNVPGIEAYIQKLLGYSTRLSA